MRASRLRREVAHSWLSPLQALWDAAREYREWCQACARCGYNERRRGMKKLLALIGEQAVEVVLVEYPDRLVRFGFSYLEQAFGWVGVRLEVLDAPKQLQPTEELVQDLLTIVTVFAGRLYGHRARGIRSRVQTALKECEETAQATTEELHGTG